MMRRELLHIWGPLSIYSYGLAIAIGLIVFIWFFLKDKRRPLIISEDHFLETVCLSLVLGIGGARLLFIFTSWDRFATWHEIFEVWSGGLSMMGGIITLLIFLPWWLRFIKVPVLPFFDITALYAPLLHAIARLGCFMAGCCYGKPSNLPWSITYTDIYSEAPLYISLHPTQLYMSAAMFLLFLFLYVFVQKISLVPGQMLMVYLMAEGLLRFSIDFLRNDLEYFTFDSYHYLSTNQWISLGLFCMSLIGFMYLSCQGKKQLHKI